MLEATRKKLDSLYAGGKHRGVDGQLHQIWELSRISEEQGEILARLHRDLRPALSVEIGLAYGFSTLFILDAMQEGSYGHHIAIDPGADDYWHGVGLRAVKESGLSERFRWLKAPSAEGLPELIGAGKRAQFIYIDGDHKFDFALVDFFLSDGLLDAGGLIAMDDMWMPSIKRVVSFISKNMKWYERVDVAYENLAVFRKIGRDDRVWDHFVEF